jgi:membrane fusion protein (multidrug efflux system)
VRSVAADGAQGSPAAAEGGGDGGMQMPPMPVDVNPVTVGSIVDEVRATGRIEAEQMVELKPDEQGRVVELLFREGQAVEKGAPLVRIDDAMLRAQKERATADQQLARQQLERVRRLRADNASTPADLERAEAAARSAEANIALLDLQLERSVVRAPFAGVVGQRFVSLGDYVTTSSPLLSLQTVNPQRVVIEVPERYAGSLRRGQAIVFTVAAHPARKFRAQVEFIDPAVQLEGRAIVVKAIAPNGDNALKAGMFVEASLAAATRTNALIVREDAIQPLRTANIVWVVADGKASRRTVQLGSRSNGVVEILDGVKAGEQVVVGGLERMADGMAVAPRGSQGGG